MRHAAQNHAICMPRTERENINLANDDQQIRLRCPRTARVSGGQSKVSTRRWTSSSYRPQVLSTTYLFKRQNGNSSPQRYNHAASTSAAAALSEEGDGFGGYIEQPEYPAWRLPDSHIPLRRAPQTLRHDGPDLPTPKGHARSTTIPAKQKQALSPVTPVTVTLQEECLVSIAQALAAARMDGLPDKVVPIPDRTQYDPTRRNSKLDERTSRRISHRRKREWERSIAEAPLKDRLLARSKLPMMAMANDILRLIDENDVCVIIGATGSGKTTQVPQLILDDALQRGEAAGCNVICTQPRRISTTSVARRVAYERGEDLQQSVGYQIRFTSKLPQHPGSITYCTTGVLLKRLQGDQDNIMQYSHILVDEVHERSVGGDFLITSIRRVLRDRRSKGQNTPKIILMSATVNPDFFVNYFQKDRNLENPLRVVSMTVPGSCYAVEIRYLDEILNELKQDSKVLPLLAGTKYDKDTKNYLQSETDIQMQNSPRRAQGHSASTADDFGETDSAETGTVDPDDRTTEALVPINLVGAVVSHILTSTPSGDILVFLPGLNEIEKTVTLLEKDPLDADVSNAQKHKIYKLHSSLQDTNDDVFETLPGKQRKIVLATNIAETSITLPEIRFVVDTGKFRQLRYDQVDRVSDFACRWISKASSIQRRGRAGRVQDGKYFALFSEERYNRFQDIEVPEVLRTDLAELCLDVKAQPTTVSIEQFLLDSPSPPDVESIRAAITDLQAIGTLTQDESITPLGRILSCIPVHPSLSRLVLMGILFRCLEPMLIHASNSPTEVLINAQGTRTRLDSVKKDYAGVSRSDQVSVITAFQDFDGCVASSNQSRTADLVTERFFRRHVYETTSAIACQVLGILVDVGVLSDAPLQPTIQDIPHELNRNAKNMPLIKALIVSSLGSNIAAWNVGLQRAWRTKRSQRALLDPRSVNNYKEKAEGSKMRSALAQGTLLAFGRKRTNPLDKYPWLSENTMVSPLSILLFGGSARLEEDVITIDNWLPIKLITKEISPANARFLKNPAKLVFEYRKAIDRFLRYAFSDLKDMSAIRQASSSDSSAQHVALEWNAMFTSSNALRESFTTALIKILDIDNQSWEETLQVNLEKAAADGEHTRQSAGAQVAVY